LSSIPLTLSLSTLFDPQIQDTADWFKNGCEAASHSEEQQHDIEDARRLIFEKGVNITSERVEKILRPESLVPTRVCYLFYDHCDHDSHLAMLEHIF